MYGYANSNLTSPTANLGFPTQDRNGAIDANYVWPGGAVANPLSEPVFSAYANTGFALATINCPTSSLTFGFARGTVPDTEQTIGDPNGDNILLQMVENYIDGCQSPDWSTDGINTNNTAILFKNRLTGENESGLPSGYGIASEPTMDWCAIYSDGSALNEDKPYTLYYGAPINRAIGTLTWDSGLPVFNPYVCPPGQNEGICINSSIASTPGTLSKSQCGEELFKVPASFTVGGDGIGGPSGPSGPIDKEIGIDDGVEPNIPQLFNALIVYKSDRVDYCTSDCRPDTPPPSCTTNDCLGFKVTYISGPVGTNLKITTDDCCGINNKETLVGQGPNEIKIFCVRCGINNNIRFDIIDVNTGINDAFIKNISSSQLFTQANTGLQYNENAGIYSGINYTVEIVDSSDPTSEYTDACGCQGDDDDQEGTNKNIVDDSTGGGGGGTGGGDGGDQQIQ